MQKQHWSAFFVLFVVYSLLMACNNFVWWSSIDWYLLLQWAVNYCLNRSLWQVNWINPFIEKMHQGEQILVSSSQKVIVWLQKTLVLWYFCLLFAQKASVSITGIVRKYEILYNSPFVFSLPCFFLPFIFQFNISVRQCLSFYIYSIFNYTVNI